MQALHAQEMVWTCSKADVELLKVLANGVNQGRNQKKMGEDGIEGNGDAVN
jgi:hypothetical protein